MPEREITTVAQYIEIVMEHGDHDLLLFRGHRSASWELVPKLGRIKPRRGQKRAEIEQALLADFTRVGRPYLPGDLHPQSADAMSIAQHHGLATRLLDWTNNALAALWFAVREPPYKNEHGAVFFMPATHDRNVDALLYHSNVSPLMATKVEFLPPRHVVQRIAAQSGWFTVHPYLEDSDSFAPIDVALCTKLLIPAECFAALRSQLDHVGVNHASMFPDLDGLSRHLNWAHTLLDDEGSERD